MFLEKEKINFSQPIISITAEGHRNWKPRTRAWDNGFSLCVTSTPAQSQQQMGWPPLHWIFKSVLILSSQLMIQFLLFSHMLGEVSPNVLLIVPKAKILLAVWNIAHTTFSAFLLFFLLPLRFCKATLKPTSAVKWICPRDIFYPEKTLTPLRTE